MRADPSISFDNLSRPQSPRFVDLSGRVFGRLLTLSFAGRRKGHVYFWCVCTCGRVVAVARGNLRQGFTKSCGCLHSERASEGASTHGHTKAGKRSPEYAAWVQMKTRCLNPKYIEAKYYSEAGITIHPRWETFENFLADMGPKPSSRHSLDRYPDPYGNYEPGNCRWATPKEQRANQRKPR